ncbi:hypothetical protein [Natronobacterium gregoryi]|uniref:Exonuclease n=2 Tax=Natronobacterium gregoryi TaxID=44930 RepID=L0AGJ1_NATGS|nr:hypothetical protein [Natronobacterium gregoryi]AFZ72175.1 hypothetical protein Natgr_0942 [Natronobacterium gregoryi SP2]ELY63051.1 hypothetical protein C490_16551 [Natronobacterium gregoryi SP2]PLK20119.1 exonuclease [Natronobacterium gregoryi SP2]SFJ32761.1 hypothetical protein SAMN05443661_12230 [Natronobacterium gregoryi]
MSTDSRPVESTTATPGLESAAFVRLVTRADGDALAASGIVARALAERGTPFQVSVGRTVAERTDRVQAPGDEGDLTLVVGAVDADVARLDAGDRPATLAAVDRVRELGVTPDPVLSLAGLVAAGVEPGAGESEWVLETATDRDLVDRRPGVAVPTADPVDGITHSTRLCGPWSGDLDAAREALTSSVDLESDDFGEADYRAIASAVALDVVGAEEATETAANAIRHGLKPYVTPDAPFATVGGYADVLEATARTEPGTGVALAMGHDAREPALSAWREYGRCAHETLESASTGRYDGLFVVGIDDGPVEAIARLAVAYRSPEPVVLAVAADGGEVAIATRDDDPLGATVERIARELESEIEIGGVAYDVGRRRGYLRYDPAVDRSTVVTTAREVL